jgi:hypothetical protein
LFNILSDLYSNINLIQYANFKDFTNINLYKCFANFHFNFNANSLFLYNYIINNNNLKKSFFKLESSKLIINKITVKKYLTKIEEFLKFALLLVYLTSELPIRKTKLLTLRFLNFIKNKREIYLNKASSLFIINISYFKNY